LANIIIVLLFPIGSDVQIDMKKRSHNLRFT